MDIPAVDMPEQRIARQENVYRSFSKHRSDNIVILLQDGQFRQLFQGRRRHYNIEIMGVASLHT